MCRIESIARKYQNVHFKQASAEDLSKLYPDNSFDLVVSHIIFNETSVEGDTSFLVQLSVLFIQFAVFDYSVFSVVLRFPH
jgi:hypothetical protein